MTGSFVVPGEEVESIVRRLRIDTNDRVAEPAMNAYRPRPYGATGCRCRYPLLQRSQPVPSLR